MPIRIRSRRPAHIAIPQPVPVAPAIAMPPAPSEFEQREPGLSLCMIVKNEERFLERCLASAADVVDEICIADTGSTDRTIEIATSFGARISRIEWRNDFSWARNISLAMATRRWILVLDADEELLPQSKDALRALKTMPAYQTAVWLRCFNRSDDYKGTGAMSHALIRIFPNRPEIRYRGLIHEFPSIDNRDTGLDAVLSPVEIEHHGYMKEVVQQRNKGQRNLEIVKAAAEQEPEDPFHWFNLGSTAYLTGDAQTARAALEKMVEIASDRPRGFIPNGLALLSEIYCDKMQDPKRAQEVAEHALRLSPRYANAHFQLGKAFLGQRLFAQARAAFEAAIEDGAHADKQFVVDDEVYIWKAHSEIGSSFVMEGDDQKAIEWFELGLRNRPNAQPLHINRARSLERLGRHAQAGEAFATVYKLYPDSPTTSEYVNYLLRHGRESDALTIIDQGLEQMDETTAVALLTAAVAITRKLGVDRDEHYLRLAAERAPGSASVLMALEQVLTEHGKAHEIAALRERERNTPATTLDDFLRRSHLGLLDGTFDDAANIALAGLQQFPEANQLRYNAGVALARSKRIEDAFAVLAPLHDANDEAAARAALLEIQMHLESQIPNSAFLAARAAARRFPNDVNIGLGLAKILIAQSDPDAAVATLYAIFDQDPPKIGVELGTLLVSLGRLQEAGRVAERAMQ